jgi:hypothetical protein
VKRGDLVRRTIRSSVNHLGLDYSFSQDKIFIVEKGPHEASIYWSDRVTSIGIAINVIDPETGHVMKDQPVSDFVLIST